tara:strand:+ start:785 stop:1264 length:480 start_codon:yes stop_codon:yes gene_type:complete
MEVELKGLQTLQKKFLRAATFCGKTDQKIKKVHRRVARASARRLKRKITTYEKDIDIYDNGEVRLTIEKGTYKRSITAWQPRGGKDSHVFYIGSRTGSKVNARKDGWMQFIVEQGKQFIEGGPDRNKGVLMDHVNTDGPKVYAQTLALYKQEFKKRFKG